MSIRSRGHNDTLIPPMFPAGQESMRFRYPPDIPENPVVDEPEAPAKAPSWTPISMIASDSIATIARLLPDWIALAASRAGFNETLADAVAEGDALGRAMIGNQIIEAAPESTLQSAPATPGWLEQALRELDQHHQHLCKVEADYARLINRARDKRAKVENARNLLLDMAEDIELGDDDEAAVAAAGVDASEHRMAA